jgi:hypothetical protein
MPDREERSRMQFGRPLHREANIDKEFPSNFEKVAFTNKARWYSYMESFSDI